jgi:hypothetical protein
LRQFPAGKSTIDRTRYATIVETDHGELGVSRLPFSAAQISTGPGDVNQFDSFLPPCPITFRMEFIPTGY